MHLDPVCFAAKSSRHSQKGGTGQNKDHHIPQKPAVVLNQSALLQGEPEEHILLTYLNQLQQNLQTGSNRSQLSHALLKSDLLGRNSVSKQNQNVYLKSVKYEVVCSK